MQSFQHRGKQVRRRMASVSWDILIPFLPGISSLHLPEPPAPSLLNSNRCPTDEQAQLVREAVTKAFEEKTKLEAQLETMLGGKYTMSTWIAATNHKMARTELFIKQHEAILAPIKRLPVEIMQEIFQCCAGHISSFSASCALETVPWDLGQVCRLWRRVALKTPTLWNVIPPGPLSKDPRRTFVQLEAVTELLRRSRKAPLHIFLYCEQMFDPRPRHPVLEVLVKHSKRWKLLSFEGSSPLLTSMRPIRQRLSSLEILRIRTAHFRATIDYFEIAPRLHTVSLTDVDLSNILLPLRQITNYRERLVRRDLWLVALSSPGPVSPLNKLTTLDLANLTLSEPLTLPKLTRLTLRCLTHSYAAPSLPHLTLPSIEAIRISASGESLVEMLAEMVSNSASSRPDGFCPLQDLYYRDRSFHHPLPGVVPHLFESTPCMNTLDVPLPSAQDIHTISVGMKREQRPMLPQLHSCKFFIQGEDALISDNVDCIDELVSLATVGSERHSIPHVTSLRNLSLYFSLAQYGTRLDLKLNKYEATGDSTLLNHLRRDLYAKFASLGRNLKMIPAILRSIDEYPIHAENVEGIYYSGIHILLKQISECGIDGTSRIANAAQAILDKWQDTLISSLDLRQWVFRGPYELVYIPPHHPIRTSEQVLDLAYELQPLPHLDFGSWI